MKKTAILFFFALLTMGCKETGKKQINEEVIMDTHQIEMPVNKFFIFVDNRDWDNVKLIFADSVFLDYTSMAGGQPSTLKSSQIIDSWKGILPGFDKTHHQLGNYLFEK